MPQGEVLGDHAAHRDAGHIEQARVARGHLVGQHVQAGRLRRARPPSEARELVPVHLAVRQLDPVPAAGIEADRSKEDEAHRREPTRR
jgi:hypothetical protein